MNEFLSEQSDGKINSAWRRNAGKRHWVNKGLPQTGWDMKYLKENIINFLRIRI